MEEFIQVLMKVREIEGLNARVLFGMAVAIMVFIAQVRLEANYVRKDKKVEKAKSLGHVVKAKKISEYKDGEPHEVITWYHAVYTYNINGNSYEYRYLERGVPPMTITLYYLTNPKKTFMDNRKSGSFVMLLWRLLPLIISIWIIKILGGV